jgi:membrane-bound serine protease (ClpP class)
MDRWVAMRGIVLALGMFFMPAPVVRANEPDVKLKAIEPAATLVAQPPRPPQTQWLDRVAEFFREPIVNVALVALGIIGLIFEIKLPGTTFPGSVAAICFVLFFWAYSFVGEFTLLAIMLFLLGLVFVGIEVFVVPGLGFSGVAGAVLMFIGLLLVTLEHWPNNENEWTDLGATFGRLTIGIAVAVVGALALTWSLPSIPLLNWIVLKPPSAEADRVPPTSLSNSGQVELLGAIGVAVTPLRPSGKAQFGGQFLDVIAEGDYVAPGCRVQVVELEGPRIVVKEV